jgi:SAM-dependent methyltransferase
MNSTLQPTFFHPTKKFVNGLAKLLKGRFVIEIGCGNGELTRALKDKGIKAVGVDPYSRNPEVIRIDQDSPILRKLLDTAIEKGENPIFLVARPCHSGFPGQYLFFNIDLLYIGFLKNLEIDVERETCSVKLVDLPKTDDHDGVVLLTRKGESDEWDSEWRELDSHVNMMMRSGVDEDLIKFFVDESDRQVFPCKSKWSCSGGEWESFEGKKLFNYDLKASRECTLNISTYYVGGGHYHSTIEVDDDQFFVEDDEGNKLCRPWDRFEQRPAWFEERGWAGIRDLKRTSNLASSLVWLKESYLALKKEYKEKYGQDLYMHIGSGLEYELEEVANMREES